MKNGILRSSLRLALPLALALALAGCRGGKIPSESSNAEFSTSKRFVVEQIALAEKRMSPSSYETKNAKARLKANGKDVTVRASISFERGGDTRLGARMIFPPVSVGSVVVTEKGAHLESKILGMNKDVPTPQILNSLFQNALLGIVPPVYRLFGDDDFSQFSIMLTADGKYVISRSAKDMSILIMVNAKDFSLAGLKVLAMGQTVMFDINEYSDFSGIRLPSSLTVTSSAGKKDTGSLEMTITDLKLK